LLTLVSAFLMDEDVVLAIDPTLSFFEWALSDAERCLTTVSGVLEDTLDWGSFGVMDFSSASGVFGDVAFIVMLSLSSGVSVRGGDGMVETTLGLRLGRVLKEVFVLLDVKPMLLSVSAGEVTSNVSVEDSVAKEALLLLDGPARVAFSFLFLKPCFFFLFCLRLSLSLATFSPE
jgi:hypothetical protein